MEIKKVFVYLHSETERRAKVKVSFGKYFKKKFKFYLEIKKVFVPLQPEVKSKKNKVLKTVQL